ncbi:uncharacterized protein LOC109846842 [Asparagus officinalis]|uniref:uncharacterized protein LOC109846842 n=1 Tax=Asparagus officinalis TaxID=4686 RepID=UPI00098E0C2A|nr:uncharacterized protein LOC109846842 [Asparagus officinalis]
MNGVSDDAIKLRLFPFSLRDKARPWLQSLPPGSITTWDQLSEAFLTKYFPPSKTAQLRNQITTFTQKESESLYDAWERYKDLLRMCPHHGLEDWLIIHTFYNGLLYNTRMTVDAADGGALMNKSVRDAKQLVEDMAQNHFQWSGERSLPKKNGRLDGIIGHSAVECQIGNSPSPDAPLSEHVNYMNNFNQKGDPFFDTYSLWWRNYPNLTHKNPPENPTPQSNFQPLGFQALRLPYPTPQKSNLETLMENFVTSQNKQNEEFRNQNRIMNGAIKNLASKVDSLATHNKMLENQITQLAQQFSFSSRSSRMFHEQPETNPKGSVNAITLRNGKDLEEPMMRSDHKDVVDESEKLVTSEKEHAGEKGENVERYVTSAPYKPPLPFPQSDMSINRALCDLGASVSRMPLSICNKLQMGDLKPTTISLQLADRSVGKFYIPVDFVILKIEEDSQIPNILGRPFLATTGTVIDVKNGKLSLNIGDEKVNFDLFSGMKFPLIDDNSCRIDTVDMVVREDFTRYISGDPLEKCLVENRAPVNDDQEITCYVTMLDESPTYTKTTYSKEPNAVAEITKGLNDQVDNEMGSKKFKDKEQPELIC